MFQFAIGSRETKRLKVRLGDKDVEMTVRTPLFRWDLGLGVVEEPAEHRGKLVFHRWKALETLVRDGRLRHTFSWRGEHVERETVKDIYAALRQNTHILAGYGSVDQKGERVAMQAVIDLSRELTLAILGTSSGRPVEEIRRAGEEAAARLTKLLGKRPRKFVKVEALTALHAAMRGTDSRGRMNPSVGMVQAHTIARRADERLGDIAAITPLIAARQDALLNLIKFAEVRLRKLDECLIPLLRLNGLLPVVLNRLARLGIAAKLGYHARDLEAIDFNPYLHTCREIARDLWDANARLRRGEVDSEGLRRIRILLGKCRSAVAIKWTQMEVERLILIITRILHLETRRPALASLVRTVGVVVSRLERVSGEIVRIDEREFRHPVCAQAIERLRLAKEKLTLAREVFSFDTLGEARESLKLASAAL